MFANSKKYIVHFFAAFFAFILLLATSNTVSAVTFTRKVFLQNVTTSSIEFRWVTDTNEQLVVKYGTSTSYGSQVTSDTVTGTGGSNNHAKISGLSPDTKYYYQVIATGGTALTPAADANHYFRTSPALGSTSPVTFAFWGDSGTNSTNQNNVAKWVFAKKPDLTFIAGDIVYGSSGYSTNFTDINTYYFNHYNDTLSGQNSMSFSPYYVTCGNHETSCASVMADHSLPNNGAAAGQSTYSFNYGNVHFVALNSNGSYSYPSDPQMAWALNDLKTTTQPWKVILWHHNGWSAGSHSTDQTRMDQIGKLAQDGGAQMVFWGHTHVYERWNRKTGFYPNTQFYSIGNGGQSGDSACTLTSPGPGCAASSNSGRSGDEAGFLFAQVSGTQMKIDYISNGGTVSDTVTLTSSGAVPTTPPGTATVTATPTNTPIATATPRPTNTPTPLLTATNTPTAIVTPGSSCLAGDANNDCKVDGIDYIAWLTHYNQTTANGYKDGDFNNDSKVDGIDYIAWLNNYGKTATITTATTSTPTTAVGATLTPTTAPSTGFQPTAPYYATFFYPWSLNPNTTTISSTTNAHTSTAQSWSYWNDLGNTPPNTWFSHYLPDYNTATFDPSSELYSSTNDQVLYWQLNKLKEAKQEVAISSWWGQGHKTDVAFNYILNNVMNRLDNPYPKLRWSLYYEKEGASDPGVPEILSDLNYIALNYINQPGYLKVNGKPVIFVYGGASDTSTSTYVSNWASANNSASTKFYVVLKLFAGYTNVTPQPDSWHQYAPAVRTDSQGSYSYMVSPGFWLDDGSAVRLPRDLTAFRNGVTNMVSSNATWKLTETWNEWGEGSSVEPGEQTMIDATGKEVIDPNGTPFKNQYVDALNQLLPPLE